ncbi:MAG: CxxC-x17-CxxC domain-containing protein [Patescibacteria group bacterium]
MNDFKKNFKPGGARQGGFSRPSFGGSSGPRKSFGDRSNGPSETFKTSCSKCHKACEVPFRPNGKKPVFCKDCFVRDDSRDSRDSRDARPSGNSYGNSYEKRSYNDRPERSERAYAPAPAAAVEDPRIGAMQRELTVVHAKLDTLIQNLESSAYAAILTTSNERGEKPAKAEKMAKPEKKEKAAKPAPKKAAKKAAKK